MHHPRHLLHEADGPADAHLAVPDGASPGLNDLLQPLCRVGRRRVRGCGHPPGFRIRGWCHSSGPQQPAGPQRCPHPCPWPGMRPQGHNFLLPPLTPPDGDAVVWLGIGAEGQQVIRGAPGQALDPSPGYRVWEAPRGADRLQGLKAVEVQVSSGPQGGEQPPIGTEAAPARLGLGFCEVALAHNGKGGHIHDCKSTAALHHQLPVPRACQHLLP
mmetsp:Transcript_116950/g.203567  ORF Transcript_116950/g.203567 Transcript_116950/m.203567 type:complete len:215 (+) Transcript_116950:115-759(+)